MLSVESNHPAYDTYFIAAAEMENTKVVSFGKKMKKVFPERVLTAADFYLLKHDSRDAVPWA